MGATYVVTLREGFEAALLLGIVYAYLDKIGGRVHYRYVTTGAVLGLLASVAAGVAVSLASGPLLDLGPDLIATAVVFAAVVLLTWHGWWMRRHARELTGDVQARIAQAQATQRLWLVGMIAFTGVFREGAETVLLLWGLLTQAASASGYDGAVGGVLGVATAGALGWAIFRGSRRVSLGRFFTATSLVLMLVAAGRGALGHLGAAERPEPARRLRRRPRRLPRAADAARGRGLARLPGARDAAALRPPVARAPRPPRPAALGAPH